MAKQRGSNKTSYWFPVGGGMHQRSIPTALRFDEAQFMYNMTFSKPGVWRSRLGNDLLATTIAGSEAVMGLGAYNPNGGDEQMFMVANTNLYKYDGITTFDLVESTITSSTEPVNMVNYMNKLYLFTESASTYVKYTSGSTTTLIGAADTRIKASMGAVAQDALWAAGRPGHEDKVYASRFDTTTKLRTHEFYESTEDMTDTTRFVSLDTEVKSIRGFKDHAMMFSDSACWTTDITSFNTQHGITKLFDVGTTSHRSVVVDKELGIMMWINENGLYMWDGGGQPVNVLQKVKNRVDADAFWDLVATGNYSTLSGGIWDGKYYLSVGDLTDASLSYDEDAGLEYDILANKMSIRSLPADLFALFTKSGDKRLYYGHSGARSVFRIGVGTQDTSTAGVAGDYTCTVQTKRFHRDLGNFYAKRIHEVLVRYKGTGTITVGYALDGAATFTELSTLSASSTEVTGRLQMDMECRDIALQLEVTSGTMEIMAVGFEVTNIDSLRLGTS